MIDVIEDSRHEFKEILNDKLESVVIGFLNAHGGSIYIGISDDGHIVGIKEDIDKLQLTIKNRIMNNIEPSTLGLFDIVIREYNNRKYVQVIVAEGNEKPYYLKKKGMTTEGCFIRIGSSLEHLTEKKIIDLFSNRTRVSLKDILSPRQDLTFTILKVYYHEKGYTINDNFLKQLGLIREDGKYNYLAYLLADENDISIKVATYSGNDAYDLIENEEYGYCSLIKATNKVIDKFELINKTFTKITGSLRKEIKMFDQIAIREAIINAIVHNAWEREYPPKFEIFHDHISITSSGGLPNNITKEDFLNGYSAPKHPGLMRVFKDMDLVEQLGTGIIRILKSYDKDVYEFSDNFIRVNFKFKTSEFLTKNNTQSKQYQLSNTQQKIVHLIEENSEITQIEMSKILDVDRTTIMRNVNNLKRKNIIERTGNNRKGHWRIMKK